LKIKQLHQTAMNFAPQLRRRRKVSNDRQDLQVTLTSIGYLWTKIRDFKILHSKKLAMFPPVA
jgi:hypothetical protein